MRFVPHALLLADAEDEEAQELLVKITMSMRAPGKPKYKHGFFDCSIYNAVRASFDELACHRCLQHVKTNVKQAARTKMKGKGLARLKRQELLKPLLDYLEASVWLPSNEFDTFWRSILD